MAFGSFFFLHVAKVLLEEGRAVGVRCSKGELRAKEAVVCNAAIWDAAKLLPKVPAFEGMKLDWQANRRGEVAVSQDTPMTRSYLHLHVGLDAQGLELFELQPLEALNDHFRTRPFQVGATLHQYELLAGCHCRAEHGAGPRQNKRLFSNLQRAQLERPVCSFRKAKHLTHLCCTHKNLSPVACGVLYLGKVKCERLTSRPRTHVAGRGDSKHLLRGKASASRALRLDERWARMPTSWRTSDVRCRSRSAAHGLELPKSSS